MCLFSGYFRCIESTKRILSLFSSTKHVVLKVSFFDRPVVHRRPSSVYIWGLLLNYWANFNQISQEWSLGDTDWKLFKDLESFKDSSCYGNQ